MALRFGIGNKKKLTQWQDEFWKHMVKKYPDFERGESASETGRTHIPPRLFKEAVRLNRQKDKITRLLSEITPLNAKKKSTEIETILDDYIPSVEKLMTRIPQILSMVDTGKIALTPAVELSYLTGQEQQDLLETMESEDCTPSLSQAIQMKKLSQSGELTMDKIFDILRELKANQQEKISFRVEDLRKYFPKTYSAARIQERILKLLEADCRRRPGRDAR